MHLDEAIDYVGSNYGPSTEQLVNIIFRCILHFAAVVACLVPMQLFYRSGELAGATLIVSGAIMNVYFFANALLWHNDDIANWPRAYGWCDIQLASAVPLETLVAASTCAILRNVAKQILSLRVTALTNNEKRRKNLNHALIIFPVPLLQGILYFFVIGMRYNISGIIGSPWIPVQLVFLYNNISVGMPWTAPFKLSTIHSDGWNRIDYSPISTIPLSHVYGTYIFALEVLIVFLYFGLTKDAHDLYREHLRALGLGKIFPKLNDDSHGPSSNKNSISARQINEVDDIHPLNIRLNSLDLEAARSTTDAARSSDQMLQLPTRNPWAFHTTPPPRFHMGSFFGGKEGKSTRKSSSRGSLKPDIHPLHTTQAPSAMGKYHACQSPSDAHSAGWSPAPEDGGVHTKVWAADACGASAGDGASSVDKELGEGVVRVERRISSSSEVSPPKPAYH
ncbi:putative pheromone receptor [Diaporthe ampelina]|uniref:Putative pheromone receptor n=1 Tax=Diaporthe ampelina TaxID=1214573 RepID=A0A0G2HE27_9PEZI|nr:putative pheromone receptor [Diaporthe ampelina]